LRRGGSRLDEIEPGNCLEWRLARLRFVFQKNAETPLLDRLGASFFVGIIGASPG
jgi:hypothetical protein